MASSRRIRTRKSHPHNRLRALLPVCLLAAVGTAGLTTRGQTQAPLPTGPDAETEVERVIPDANRYSGRVFLEQADRLVKPSAAVDYQVVVGNVIFRRADMYMYCDSAHYYDSSSSFEAFGNVRMEQGDTLFVYANRLLYTDSTQLAVLYADTTDCVRLINRDVILTTDIFNYDLGIELGYYETGGELVDNKNRLTSIYGEYAPPTKDAVFRERVVLTGLGDKDTLVIRTDDLRYNTDTHIAELTAPSTVTSKDGTIYTESGVYNTETTVADLYERSTVVTSTGRTLTGDTIFYDHARGYGEAFGNMVLTDTVNRMRLLGDYGFYNELTDSAFVTGRALAIDYSSADSLSLHGDTIQAYRIITINRQYVYPTPAEPVDTFVAVADSLSLPVDTLVQTDETLIALTDSLLTAPDVAALPDTITAAVEQADSTIRLLPDSLSAVPLPLEPIQLPELEPEVIETADTARFIVAYPNVRFYRTDLQGVCDSMTYVARDSLLHLNRDPMVWSDNRQIFGNAIVVHLNDSTADRVNLPNTGFMAEEIEEGFYNQMSGREMVAYLSDGALRHLDVSGNVLITFFPMNDADSTYTKVANAESSFLAADFKNQSIEKLKMWSQSSETITPLYLAKRSIFFLPGFRWEPWRRPKGHDDLLTVPVDPAEVLPDTSEQSDSSEQAESSEQTDNSDSTTETPTL